MAFLGPSLRRKRVTDRPVSRAVVAGLLSLLVNGGLLVALAYAGAFDLGKPVKQERVQLAELTPEQWSQNRAIAGAPKLPALPPPVATPTPSAPTPEVAPPPPREKGQVVDVTPGNDQRPSDRTRFLAEHDNRVDKETKSRHAGTELYKNRAAGPVAGSEEKKKATAGQGGADDETKEAQAARGGKGAQKPRPQQAQKAPADEGDRVAMLDRPKLPQVSPGERWSPGQSQGPGDDEEGLGAPGPAQPGEQGKKKSGDANLVPSLDSLARIAGGPSNDYIDGDVEEGDTTALNTRAFRFATFWNRFKQDVADHWFPAVRYDITSRDPQGDVFGRRGWLTELRIVLDGAGAVKDVQVIGPSGLDFLDRVAVKSVRAAAPFYNVPKSLLDAKGELAFEFGFMVGDQRGVPVRPRYHPRP
jgi:TonB family protein